MLAMADKNGRVWASIPGLANRARVTLEQTEEALERFLSPDPYSRTPDHEGRRIEAIDGGWVLINHAKYRAIRDTEARKAYKAAWIKEKRKVDKVDSSRPQYTKAEADTEADTENICFKGLDQKAWDDFLQHRKEIKKPLTPLAYKKNLNILEKYPNQQRAIVDKTITNGWRGLFAPTKSAPLDIEQLAKEKNLSARPGESWDEFTKRVLRE